MPLELPHESSVEEDAAGIKVVPSHGISIDLPSTGEGSDARPSNIRHMYGHDNIVH